MRGSADVKTGLRTRGAWGSIGLRSDAEGWRRRVGCCGRWRCKAGREDGRTGQHRDKAEETQTVKRRDKSAREELDDGKREADTEHDAEAAHLGVVYRDDEGVPAIEGFDQGSQDCCSCDGEGYELEQSLQGFPLLLRWLKLQLELRDVAAGSDEVRAAEG